KPIDRVRPRLLADRGELVADLAHGLVPGHTRPLAVDQLHRVAQTPIAVHKLAHRGTLGAMRPAIDRRIPAGLLADPHAVRDFRHDRAADRAMRADALADGDLRAGGRRGTRLGLAHAAKRQRAERGEAAGGEAGATQKGAAIETAVALAWERAGERAATSLTFRSLDQHGLPPSARVSIDPIEGLHLLRVRLVARLALLIVAFAIGARFVRQRCGARRRDGGARAERAQEFTTAERCFAFSLHSRLPPLILICCAALLTKAARRLRSR